MANSVDLNLGLIVLTIVSLTKSLVDDLLSLTVLTKSTATIFFAEKFVRNFPLNFSAENGRTYIFVNNAFEISMTR